ncbi:hypothetical protein UC34_14615 [Pandoraea vervacti]|uniref:Uncharacterized protein n=1 Tax=Pandoraea vervacti TaxID=656178 RepID=A0ABN4G2N3_9BURK|nr:hypothetical protein [Pandoraea vervacti]AJP57875.2 hypothetical protein UC34_14615 [Pandoraea vervacti]
MELFSAGLEVFFRTLVVVGVFAILMRFACTNFGQGLLVWVLGVLVGFGLTAGGDIYHWLTVGDYPRFVGESQEVTFRSGDYLVLVKTHLVAGAIGIVVAIGVYEYFVGDRRWF